MFYPRYQRWDYFFEEKTKENDLGDNEYYDFDDKEYYEFNDYN